MSEAAKWKPIPEWEGYYEVSTQGEVGSVDRLVSDGSKFRGKLRSLKIGKNGYVYTSLYRGGQAKYGTVHRLVALAFHGPCPDGYDVCHRNGVRADNRPENLYYGTRSQNNLDKRAHGTDHNARKTHCIHGHAFDAINTRWTPDGNRACRTCAASRKSKVAKSRRKPGMLYRGRWAA